MVWSSYRSVSGVCGPCETGETVKDVVMAPRFLTCYLCGQQFGKTYGSDTALLQRKGRQKEAIAAIVML